MRNERIDRSTYMKTRHRGLSYRLLANGTRRYFAYIPGRGRVPLQSAGERDAVAEAGELRGKVSRGERIPPRNTRFSEALEAWWTSDESPRATSTRKLYRSAIDRDLLPRLGHRKLVEIRLDDLLALIRQLKERGLARSTIESYLCPVRGTFEYALRRGLVATSPCNLLRKRDITSDDEETLTPYEWSDEEIDALTNAASGLAREPWAKYDYTPVIRLSLGTGLRRGELLGLEWQDIDLANGVLDVRRQYTRYGELTPPKTRKGIRRIPLTAELVDMLRELRVSAFAAGYAKPDDPVFASRTGGRLQHRNVTTRGFEAARDKAGLPKRLRYHDMRHAFASCAAHRGVPINLLSSIMGHANISITANTYVHLYARDQAEEDFRTVMERRAP